MAARLVALLGGGKQEREAAYAELLRLALAPANPGPGADLAQEYLQHPTLIPGIAVACASPLCVVLSNPATEVDAEVGRFSVFSSAWFIL